MSQKIKQKDDISIGNNLKRLRKAAKLTQNDVITKLQLLGFPTSRSVYSQMEGGTYNIRISELAALTQIFQVDYNAIFAGVSIPDSKNSMAE